MFVAAAMAAGLFFGGFDSGDGRAIAFLLCGGTLVLLLLLDPPPPDFWRRIAPVAALVALAWLWLVLGMAWSRLKPLAPDLVTIDLLGTGAGTAALLAGTLFAYRRGAVVTAIDLWLMLAILSFGVAAADAIGLIDWAGGASLWRRDRFVGLVGNANILSVIAGAVILLSVSRLLTALRGQRGAALAALRPQVVLYSAIALCGAGTMLATGSRASVALVVLFLLLLFTRGLQHGPSQRGIFTVLAIIALLAAAVLADHRGVLMSRIDAVDADTGFRLAMWSRYLEVALAQPWFGHGPGSFPEVNRAALNDPLLAQATWSANSAHNLLLQLVLKGGAPYALALLAAAALVLRDIIRYFAGARRSVEAWGLLTVIALILGSSLVDIALDVPATIILAMFATGFLWGETLSPRRASASPATAAAAGDRLANGGRG